MLASGVPEILGAEFDAGSARSLETPDLEVQPPRATTAVRITHNGRLAIYSMFIVIDHQPDVSPSPAITSELSIPC
jgi:hypothetical protein